MFYPALWYLLAAVSSASSPAFLPFLWLAEGSVTRLTSTLVSPTWVHGLILYLTRIWQPMPGDLCANPELLGIGLSALSAWEALVRLVGESS